MLNPLETTKSQKEAPAYEFKSYMNGKQIKTTTKKGILNPKLPKDLFEKVMTFSVHFDAAEDKAVRHTYYIGGEGTSDGHHVISYILRTGALWRDVIEDCAINIEMPKRLGQKFHIVSPKEHRASIENDKIRLHWQFYNIKPDFDIHLEALPDFIVKFNSDELMKFMKSTNMYLESEYVDSVKYT
ncbi:MAG TPA: hypothetical protein VGJ93_10935 [Desulfuromonadaceae bacterium]|jgi:hypothetical protein